MYRRGDLSQAALHVSDSASCQQGPFAPRELPRFPATTTPSDFRPCSTSWLWIPNRAFWSIPQHAGSPRFLDFSLGTRCPLPPRRARRVHMPVTSPPMLASPSLKGWPLSISLTRLNRVRFRYGSHRAPCRASGLGCPHSLPARLHVSQAFHMVNSFSSQEKPGLAWRTRAAEQQRNRAVLCCSAALRENLLFSDE